MTKRQQLGFTFLTCGLAALASVACSDSGGEENPLASTGGGSGTDVTLTGGATGTGGGAATGGGSSTSNTGGGSSTPAPENSTYTVQAGGFVVSGSWQGYAWTAVQEDTTIASSITPADFSAVAAGDQICVSGTVGANVDYQGVAMVGFNVNQLADAAEGSEGTWAYTGTTGIEYAVTMNVDSPLRIQIQGPLGYPDEAWCASAGDASAQIPWTDFNKTCWDNKGTYYDADGYPALEAVMFLVPGDDNTDTPFNFCVSSIGPY